MINSKSAKSVHPWIHSTKFEAMPQADVLNGILQNIKDENKARIRNGGQPLLVVFDLDSTVFDVKPRSLRILKEFAQTDKAKEISPAIASWCLGLHSFQLLYTLGESARANAIPADEALAKTFINEAFKYWFDRFFTHSYLTVDHPVPGAVDYVNKVVDAGAKAVYLTGRDWPGMGKGTRAMLEYWGFPTDPKVSELLMKPNAGLDDAEYKDEALRELRIEGNALALFDNEPANFKVFEKNFPNAWLVFFYSNCSSKEAMPVQRVFKIDSFLI